MPQFIRMITDREGAHDHINIALYQAGEIYHRGRVDPPISQDLLDGFIASGHAIEVDEQGNPIGIPADRRATKPTGPRATKDAPAQDNPPAPPIREALISRLYPADDDSPGESPPAK